MQYIVFVHIGDDYLAAIAFTPANVTLAAEDDGVSEAILISAGFPIGSSMQFYAYVSSFNHQER